jgi:hypothetical protein
MKTIAEKRINIGFPSKIEETKKGFSHMVEKAFCLLK